MPRRVLSGDRCTAAGGVARREARGSGFVLEEESDTRRLSIHRLAHYCLDLAELMEAARVVPVVVFLRRATGVPQRLCLSGD